MCARTRRRTPTGARPHDSELPVTLPDLEDFKPKGSPEGPLAGAAEWLDTTDPESGRPHLAHAACCVLFALALEPE